MLQRAGCPQARELLANITTSASRYWQPAGGLNELSLAYSFNTGAPMKGNASPVRQFYSLNHPFTLDLILPGKIYRFSMIFYPSSQYLFFKIDF